MISRVSLNVTNGAKNLESASDQCCSKEQGEGGG
jgi:hypothetical protein